MQSASALHTGNQHTAPVSARRSHRRVDVARCSSQNGRSDASDLRLELWSSLQEAAAKSLQQALTTAVSDASTAASTTAARVRRLLEAPPPGFPPGPSGDQAVSLLAGPLAFLEGVTQQHGGAVGLLLGGERVVLLAEPELAKQVMIDKADVFVKKGTAFFPGSSLTGNGLLVSDGDVWRRQRRLSNPAFRRAAVDSYAAAMQGSTQDMLSSTWATGGVRDVYADFNELTLRITLEALFGFTTQRTGLAPGGTHTAAGGRSRAGPQAVQNTAGSGSSSSGSAPLPSKTQQHGDAGDSDSSHAINGHAGLSATARDVSQPAASSVADEGEARTIVVAVAKAFEFFTRRAGAGMMLPEWLPTWDNVEFGVAVAQLDRVVYRLIGTRRAEMAAPSPGPAGLPQSGSQGRVDGAPLHAAVTPAMPSSSSQSHGSPAHAMPRPTRPDLLNSLLAVRDDDGTGMTDVALRDELMTLLVAGQETSAILLGWACALLAHHPAAQAAAQAEVDALLQGAAPTAADTRRLPAVEAVVLEALRLYSPAYLVGRCAGEDVQLGPYTLPAGTTVLVSPYLLQRNAAIWGPAADAFQPTRWQAWQASASQSGAGFMALLSGMGPNGAYLPFGSGPRNCIGTGFAMVEAILVLATILQRYQLAPASPQAPFPVAKPLITLRPGAVELLVTPRSAAGVRHAGKSP